MTQMDEPIERIADTLRQIELALDTIAEALKDTKKPSYSFHISEFPNFEFGKIGASVENVDSKGWATTISWEGNLYGRKEVSGKLIFFEDAKGKHNLIRFFPYNIPQNLSEDTVKLFEQSDDLPY